MRTFEQYQEKLFSMRKNVYIDGELVGRDDPRLLGGQNIMKITFGAALSDDPEIRELATATSTLTGKKISRFAHVYMSIDDMLKKQEMIRTLGHIAGGCIQRCMGCDAINALYVGTYECDQAHGTNYHERFKKWLTWHQENDIVANGGQTDVKGDRSKRPSQQVDPDLYMHIEERREDGIVVSGCKAHNTTAPYSDEILVIPTRAMREDDADWAVAFAVPAGRLMIPESFLLFRIEAGGGRSTVPRSSGGGRALPARRTGSGYSVGIQSTAPRSSSARSTGPRSSDIRSAAPRSSGAICV